MTLNIIVKTAVSIINSGTCVLLLIKINVNTTEANPLGPNQASVKRLLKLRDVKLVAMITGTIRIMVRAQIAYNNAFSETPLVRNG